MRGPFTSLRSWSTTEKNNSCIGRRPFCSPSSATQLENVLAVRALDAGPGAPFSGQGALQQAILLRGRRFHIGNLSLPLFQFVPDACFHTLFGWLIYLNTLGLRNLRLGVHHSSSFELHCKFELDPA